MTKQSGNMYKEIGKCQGYDKLKEESLKVKNNDFVLFIAEIINCSAQMKRRMKGSK